ncbi:MAG: DUF6152 family protein [Caulobacteraceae bacterium]
MAVALGSLLGVFGLALAAPATAHHAFAMFDTNREVMLEGTVKEFQWTNPHTWVQLLVKDSGGKEVEWSIEGSSPNNLARFGWTRNSLKSGDHVQAVVHPLKDGSIGGSLVKITVNGQVVGAAKPS